MKWFTFQEHQSSPIVEAWTAHHLIKELLLFQEAGAGRGLTPIIAQRTVRTTVFRSKQRKQTSDHVPGMFTLSTSTAYCSAHLLLIWTSLFVMTLPRSFYSFETSETDIKQQRERSNFFQQFPKEREGGEGNDPLTSKKSKPKLSKTSSREMSGNHFIGICF